MEEKKSLSENELYQIGATMCARTEHCAAEVCSKLQKGTDDQELLARVMARLVEEKFIDEERYARAFINDKFRFAKWGRLKIQHELRRKQVPESVYTPLLAEIDEKQYIATLRELLKSKKKSIKGKEEYDKKIKLLRFGASRGFELKYLYAALDMDADVPDEKMDDSQEF